MGAGGEALLPRDAWPGPASDGAEASGRDAWGLLASVEDRVWIIDPQTLFRRGLALLLQQWNPSFAALDAPDLGAALATQGGTPALVLVDAALAGRGGIHQDEAGHAVHFQKSRADIRRIGNGEAGMPLSQKKSQAAAKERLGIDDPDPILDAGQ